MSATVAEQCSTCVANLKSIASKLNASSCKQNRVRASQISDEVGRLGLWAGNIGAMHLPASVLSLESRLRDENEILVYVKELLKDLSEAVNELLKIVSGDRTGERAVDGTEGETTQEEESELLRDIGSSTSHLFRISSLIRQAAPTDLFAKAVSRDRYLFNDQFDINHVGEKYPKLAEEHNTSLRKRLGQAITKRRHYLRYIRDHQEKLIGGPSHTTLEKPIVFNLETPNTHQISTEPHNETASRPSTFFTRASSLTPGNINIQMLTAVAVSESEDDSKSYTTISRSIDGNTNNLTSIRIPKLDKLQIGAKKEVECPFCFRVRRFKNQRVWQQHVLSDLRCYVCTFPDCEVAYFSDVNEWFRHEMQMHRVIYTCKLCNNRTFTLANNYLGHVQRRHPQLLEDDEQKIVCDIARRSLTEIPAQDCPCCSDWLDRLKERGLVPETSEDIVCVDPTVFKRHLASHLEQLALFAVPLITSDDNDLTSNAAVDEDDGAPSQQSIKSSLVFESLRSYSEVPRLDEIIEQERTYSHTDALNTDVRMTIPGCSSMPPLPEDDDTNLVNYNASSKMFKDQYRTPEELRIAGYMADLAATPKVIWRSPPSTGA